MTYGPPSSGDHRLGSANMAKRQAWARHLRDEHGYRLDIEWPVSEAALARIRFSECEHQEAS